MSYALGGIGLPHLDVGKAVEFFDVLSASLPQAKQDLQRFSNMPGGFRYDVVRAEGGVCAPDPGTAVLMTDLDGEVFRHEAATLGGTSYCKRFNPDRKPDFEAWRRLRHWCRVGLRRRDMQEWVIKDWINSFWVPAYNEVMQRPSGTFREALVVARIWNTSRGSALSALNAAGAEPDPKKRISAELAHYADERTKAQRTRKEPALCSAQAPRTTSWARLKQAREGRHEFLSSQQRQRTRERARWNLIGGLCAAAFFQPCALAASCSRRAEILHELLGALAPVVTQRGALLSSGQPAQRCCTDR